MKISEFAEINNVTTKMLRHYDDIGLLKPSQVDHETGYRFYDDEQSMVLNWIIILKNLDFTLAQIKEMLNGPIDSRKMITELVQKRIEISSSMNEQIQKKIEIDKLIKTLEKEGFHLDKQINLMNIEQDNVHEIKKNIPNMEMFLETANNILSLCLENDYAAVFRFDLYHFKQVNDDCGYEVGDAVIVACYNIIKANIEKYLKNAAFGRAHGDEFIVFAKAGKADIEIVSRGIIDDMTNYNFSALGCTKRMACYIGGLVCQKKSVNNIRKMIESSIETINQARKNGMNSIVIDSYNE